MSDRGAVEPYKVGRLRGGFCIRYTDAAGAPHRNALGASSYPAAVAEAARVWKARSAGHGDRTGSLVEAWLRAHTTLAAATRNRDAWTAAAPFFADVAASHITADVCRAYCKQRGRAARTVRYELEIVRRACNWAKVEPAPTFWFPPLPDRTVRNLTKDEFRTFIAGTRAPHVRLFAMLAVATGGRATALLELQWDQVKLDEREIVLNRPGRAQSRNKKRARVPINDQLHAALAVAKPGAISPFVIECGGERVASVKKGMLLASQRSGVKVTPHMFRHSAAVWMVEGGRPMSEVAQYLGHDDERTTARVYARFSPGHLRAAAEALEW